MSSSKLNAVTSNELSRNQNLLNVNVNSTGGGGGSSTPSPVSTTSSSMQKSLNLAGSSINSTYQQQQNQILYLAKGNGQLSNGSYVGGASNSMTDSASMGTSYNGAGGSTMSGSVIANPTSETKKKIGHREVKHGVVMYKKFSTDELKKSIQFGIVHYLNEKNRHQLDRDVIMQDFQFIETIQFPKAGTSGNPPHSYNDFKLKIYAPNGFRILRRKMNVNEVDFMHALADADLKEMTNPGASGSVFYKTSNDKYILKTVQYQECEFLKTLLAGYALNLLQNIINGKFSLLPTIYGLYCYQKLELASMLSDKTNIRIVIMNNILPSDVPIHEKFDLKGSLYKRKASKQERAKSSPTFKDIDFLAEHPDGLTLDEKQYENIISSLKRDCLILQSFGIMDYSMLLGIHNLEKEKNNTAIEAYYEAKVGVDHLSHANNNANTNTNTQTQSTLSTNSTSNDSVQPSTSSVNQSISSPIPSNYKSSMSSSSKNWDNVFNISAVPARSGKGERLLIYFGIIDILQSYRLKKRLEHTFKKLITDGETISVCPPDFYARRFIDFMTQKVFKKAKEGEFKKYGRKIMNCLALKGSPIRKRLTFKLDSKKDELNQSLNSPVNSQSQFSTPLGSTTQSTSPSQAATFAKNVGQLKAIDSVDSVSGLLDRPVQAEANGPSKVFTNQNKIFSNIVEAEADSSPKHDSSSSKKNFEYNNIKNDNDNVDISKPISNNVPRAPITPIIKHYENKNSNHVSPLSTNSISMKLEPHPTAQLKSFEKYNDQMDQHHSSSITNKDSSVRTNRTGENQKFNEENNIVLKNNNQACLNTNTGQKEVSHHTNHNNNAFNNSKSSVSSKVIQSTASSNNKKSMNLANSVIITSTLTSTSSF